MIATVPTRRIVTLYCLLLYFVAVPVSAAQTLPKATLQDNVVTLPAREIPPQASAEFALPLTGEDRNDRILLRFEAVLRHSTEAGYAQAARISVNGVVLDDSRFPVNWKDKRTWSIPNLTSNTHPVFGEEAKAWTLRYDCDATPPGEKARYYSPEFADKYVYMFPIGGLLHAGENRIRVENTSGNYTLKLIPFNGKTRGRIDNLRAVRISDTSVELAWKSEMHRLEIDYRRAGEPDWQTISNVLEWENPYNVILLSPGMKYEFRVRGPFQSTADLHGKVTKVAPVESNVLVAQTRKSPEPRHFAGLDLMPTRLMPGDLSFYPCVESHGGFLWIVDGGLRLIKLDPRTGELVFKRDKPLAGWPFDPPAGYMGIPDTTVFDGKLWVMYNAQPPTKPVSASRQLILSYDFDTDTASEPVFVEPTRPNSGTWEGGIQAFGGKLWVMHMDVWLEGDRRRTQIVLRTLDDGRFSPPIVYDNCPTVFPYGPSISVFNNKLVLLFSDLSAGDTHHSREPLLYTVFDGRAFSEARTILDEGRSRYAKGVQIGDRFLCAYKCSAPYHEQYGYQYHDIAVSVFTPGSNAPVDTVMYVNDRKYNSSPDVALHNGEVFVVHNKSEHLYGDRDNPAAFCGDFWGRIGVGEGKEGHTVAPR